MGCCVAESGSADYGFACNGLDEHFRFVSLSCVRVSVDSSSSGGISFFSSLSGITFLMGDRHCLLDFAVKICCLRTFALSREIWYKRCFVSDLLLLPEWKSVTAAMVLLHKKGFEAWRSVLIESLKLLNMHERMLRLSASTSWSGFPVKMLSHCTLRSLSLISLQRRWTSSSAASWRKRRRQEQRGTW